MSTKEDMLAYDAEEEAFRGTPLGDRQDRSSLILEAREIATRCPVLVGQVFISEGSAHMTAMAGYAQPGSGRIPSRIVFAPTASSRYIAVHEVAHVVHRRAGTGGRPHGPEWRGVYVDMVEIVYGEQYGQLLRDAFQVVGIPASFACLPSTGEPLVDIDKLVESTQEVRWL